MHSFLITTMAVLIGFSHSSVQAAESKKTAIVSCHYDVVTDDKGKPAKNWDGGKQEWKMRFRINLAKKTLDQACQAKSGADDVTCPLDILDDKYKTGYPIINKLPANMNFNILKKTDPRTRRTYFEWPFAFQKIVVDANNGDDMDMFLIFELLESSDSETDLSANSTLIFADEGISGGYTGLATNCKVKIEN